MKLYTRTGDEGETSLFDGTRVGKHHPRVVACGELDEVNALLGWCRTADGASLFDASLHTIQRALFSLGAELATPLQAGRAPAGERVGADAIARLEGWIDRAVEATPELKNFVLPGGTELAARFHVARTACRRAERAVVVLMGAESIRNEPLTYLNRLSDLLFAWARQANHAAGHADVLWMPES